MTRFCIIIGAMKAGTTSLFNYLAQHPQIAPCSEKEPNFFSHHYEKGMDWYLSLWKKQETDNKILLEASTNYAKFPSFAKSSENIADFAQKHGVSLKFIYVLRNPINRLESQYTYSFARWTSKTLEERLQHGHIIHVSRYAQQLDRYWDYFNPNDFLLLDFDDLKNNTGELLRNICLFLNIDPDFDFSGLRKIHNKSEGKIVTRPIENLYRKYPYLETFAKIFPKKFKLFIQRIFFYEKISKKFKLTDQQKQHVYDELKDDMARLHKKYGVDIKKWGF